MFSGITTCSGKQSRGHLRSALLALYEESQPVTSQRPAIRRAFPCHRFNMLQWQMNQIFISGFFQETSNAESVSESGSCHVAVINTTPNTDQGQSNAKHCTNIHPHTPVMQITEVGSDFSTFRIINVYMRWHVLHVRHNADWLIITSPAISYAPYPRESQNLRVEPPISLCIFYVLHGIIETPRKMLRRMNAFSWPTFTKLAALSHEITKTRQTLHQRCNSCYCYFVFILSFHPKDY